MYFLFFILFLIVYFYIIEVIIQKAPVYTSFEVYSTEQLISFKFIKYEEDIEWCILNINRRFKIHLYSLLKCQRLTILNFFYTHKVFGIEILNFTITIDFDPPKFPINLNL